MLFSFCIFQESVTTYVFPSDETWVVLISPSYVKVTLVRVMCSINFDFRNAERGEVYTWGWKECVPSGKVIGDQSTGGNSEKQISERQSSLSSEQGIFIHTQKQLFTCCRLMWRRVTILFQLALALKALELVVEHYLTVREAERITPKEEEFRHLNRKARARHLVRKFSQHCLV